MKLPLDAVTVEGPRARFAHIDPDQNPGEGCGPNTTGKPDEPKRPLTEEERVNLVREGYYAIGPVPYALKPVRERKRSNRRKGKWMIRTRLEPGDQQEVDVVRLIYDLYGCRNMPVNHILNNLRAQNIPARKNNLRWSLEKIERILTDPVYIGAARYKEFVRYGAFPPIVEPWIYYAALSRRHFEKMRGFGPSVQKVLKDSDGGSDE